MASVPYLALPAGWRFLLGLNHEDVWFDANLPDGSPAQITIPVRIASNSQSERYRHISLWLRTFAIEARMDVKGFVAWGGWGALK
jgi:hypothetical protein